MSTRKIDYLTEDTPIPGQVYVCISFLSPEGIRNCKVRGLKVRGVHGTREAADRHAAELQKIDPDFHVFVGEIGKWLPWDPDPNSVADQEYREDELQNLMKAYKKNQEQVKEVERERKDELMKNAKADSSKQATINRLRKKLEQKRQTNGTENKVVEELEVIEGVLEQENKIKNHENLIKETELELKNIQDSLKPDLDTNLSKITELYNNLHTTN